ncbi:MAG: shikimate kinase, partial [Bacteroidota bacterium]
VIYLKVTEEELGTRIQNSDTPRPLFSDSKEYEKSVRRIKIMLEERKKDYQRAHITIENSNKDTEALDKILKAL